MNINTVSFPLSSRSYISYTTPRPPPRPRRRKHVQAPTPTLQAISFCPPPQKKGVSAEPLQSTHKQRKARGGGGVMTVGFAKEPAPPFQPTLHKPFTDRSQDAATSPTLTSPTPTQTCPSANTDNEGDFLFLYFPPPKRGGGAAARARGNGINTAATRNRLRAWDVVVF
jgi:hypothetical protein